MYHCNHAERLVSRPVNEGMDLFSTPPDYMLIYALIGWFVCWIIGKAIGLIGETIDKLDGWANREPYARSVEVRLDRLVKDVADLRQPKGSPALCENGGDFLNIIKKGCRPFAINLLHKLMEFDEDKWNKWVEDDSACISVKCEDFHVYINFDGDLKTSTRFHAMKNGVIAGQFSQFSRMESFLFFVCLSPMYYKVSNLHRPDAPEICVKALARSSPAVLPEPPGEPLFSLENRIRFVLKDLQNRRTFSESQKAFLGLLEDFLIEHKSITKKQLTQYPFTTVHPYGITGVFTPLIADEILNALCSISVLNSTI